MHNFSRSESFCHAFPWTEGFLNADQTICPTFSLTRQLVTLRMIVVPNLANSSKLCAAI